MAVTLKEIAKIVGVTPSTVSRVVNNKTYSASEELKDKILATIAELGYVPNQTAKNLRASKNTVNKSVVSCVFARVKSGVEDAFFNDLLRNIHTEILNHGMQIGRYFYYDEIDMHREEILKATKGHGLVVLGRFSCEAESFLKNYRNNVVFITLNESSDLPYDQIVCDGGKATVKALEYLLTLGHTQIAYAGECLKEVRYSTYIKFMRERRLEVPPKFIVNCGLSQAGGYLAGKFMIEKNIVGNATAILCANDVTASGVLKAFNENKVNVPKDVSIISIDDIELASGTTPPLTTIRIPRHEMSKFAIRILKSRMERKHSLPITVLIPHDLAVRDTVSKNSRI